MEVLAVAGSLQARSSNAALVRTAHRVAPGGVDVRDSLSIGDVPHFNPDIERDGPPPAAVAILRTQIASADGVLIASPEYAHSLPGVLKNALDWIVGSGELYGKPVAVLCASPRPDGGVNARAAIEQTLRDPAAVATVRAALTALSR